MSSPPAGPGMVNGVSTEKYNNGHALPVDNYSTSYQSPDAYDLDYSLMYPQGFYNQNGYFYCKLH